MDFKALIIAINNIEILRKYDLTHQKISALLRLNLINTPHYGGRYYNVYIDNLRFKFRVKNCVYKLILLKEYQKSNE